MNHQMHSKHKLFIHYSYNLRSDRHEFKIHESQTSNCACFHMIEWVGTFLSSAPCAMKFLILFWWVSSSDLLAGRLIPVNWLWCQTLSKALKSQHLRCLENICNFSCTTHQMWAHKNSCNDAHRLLNASDWDEASFGLVILLASMCFCPQAHFRVFIFNTHIHMHAIQ